MANSIDMKLVKGKDGKTYLQMMVCVDGEFNLSSSQKTRWIKYANQTIWNVWNHETAKWGARYQRRSRHRHADERRVR